MEEKCQFLSLNASYLTIQVLKTSLTSGAKQSKSKKADSTLKTGTYVGTNGTYVYDGTVLIEDEKVRQRDGYPEPIPKKNSDGVLLFSDAKEFRPNMTPKEVLQAGSFGGTYFRPIKSSVTGLKYNKMWNELPQNWLEGKLLYLRTNVLLMQMYHLLTYFCYRPQSQENDLK